MKCLMHLRGPGPDPIHRGHLEHRCEQVRWQNLNTAASGNDNDDEGVNP